MDRVKDASEIGYIGFDFSGYGMNDNRSPEGNLECRIDNFKYLKAYFPNEFKDLTFDKFKLYSFKGSMWWGTWFNHTFDLTGRGTDDIIIFLLEHYKLWMDDVPRIVTQSQRYKVLDRQNWKCNICHCRLKYSIQHKFEAKVGHIDHIHPFSKRDSYPNGRCNINEDNNLQGLCPDCNLKKNKKEIN